MKFTRREAQILFEWCLIRNHAEIPFPPRFLRYIWNHYDGVRYRPHRDESTWAEEFDIPNDDIPFEDVLRAITENPGMEDGPTPHALWERLREEMKK